jgi:hypothetical protein
MRASKSVLLAAEINYIGRRSTYNEWREYLDHKMLARAISWGGITYEEEKLQRALIDLYHGIPLSHDGVCFARSGRVSVDV